MKNRIIISSILTIALCLCLIAGSTFALFTDTTSFNIAVTSGDVEIKASAKINSLYSAEGATVADDEYLVDEKGHTYTHKYMGDENSTFLNGGNAKVTDGNLEIFRITPGDRVDVDIIVENLSDVAISYRYKVIADDINLAYGMVVTVEGQSYEAFASYTSEWRTVVYAPGGTPGTIPTETISVELPVYAGNEYQTEYTEGKTESVSYTIIVEAVQGNAVTDDESEVITYNTSAIVADGVGETYENREVADTVLSNAAVVKDLYLVGDSTVALETIYDTAILENVTADVDGHLIYVTAANTIILYDCNITLDPGEKLVVADSSLFPYDTQVMLHNVTVNGELVTNATIGQYVENVGYCEVW